MKCERVVVEFDRPASLLARWLAGGLGFLGLACTAQGETAGLALMAGALAAAAAARRAGEQRLVDAKSRTIWRLGFASAEPWLAFDECRSLRVVRQPSLSDGRDNHRFVLELEDRGGRCFVLGDHVTPEDATRVAELLALVPQRD